MIHVDRERVDPPPILDEGAGTQMERTRSTMQMTKGPVTRSIEAPFHDAQVMAALFDVFHGKCAYCETRLSDSKDMPSTTAMIDLFRPKSGAMGHAETDDAWRYSTYYWWLAFEWNNLFLACQACTRNKATWFPVLGERVWEEASWEETENEESRLFIDPCVDDPELFLSCDDLGYLVVETVEGEAEGLGRSRGETTIELIGLNRAELVKARMQRIVECNEAFPGEGATDQELDAFSEAFLTDGAPYALACRKFIERHVTRAEREPQAMPEQIVVQAAPEVKKRTRDRVARSRVKAESAPSIERTTAYIEHVSIESFQPLANIDLTLPAEAPPSALPSAEEEPPDGLRSGWNVVLGENGSGKSAMLKAIALGLAGEDEANRLLEAWGVEPKDLQRRTPRNQPKAPPLEVVLQLSARPHTISYEIAGGRLRFTSGAEGVKTVVRAYGTSRLPPRRRDGENDEGAEISVPLFQVDSLFDPHATLIDAENWLLYQPPQPFERAAAALADLFSLPAGAVYRTKREVKVRRGRQRDPLSQLSDGYQALTGLVADLMSAVPGGVDDFRQETGIVLVDELGVHLHPAWRMRVVEGLRAAFPRFQFLATTHEPLCLRGLRNGEVAVMWREPSGMSMLNSEVPPVEGLRVDQLLTSSIFGLDTTIDPALNDLFTEYYRLLAKRESGRALTEREQARTRRLEQDLMPVRVLGYTRRDQLVYEFIDDFLSQTETLDPAARGVLKNETKERVLEVWNRVELADRQ